MEAGGFSIRDYTYSMRKIDVFKCWPFPIDGLTREEIESRLPPMEVRMPSSNRGREEETNNQPKVEDVCPSDNKPPSPPPPSSVLTLMGAQPSINEYVDKTGILTNIQVLNMRLQALRFTVDSEKSDEVNLNLVKEDEGEELEMVCSICKVFKATVVTVMDMHIKECLEKKEREEERQTRLSSNRNRKMRRKRTLIEIFNLPS